ncbi:MAG: hypothetical protein JKY50_00095 [Oleispira sp.]|nr:hypothetical protein [Oleispira sp.]
MGNWTNEDGLQVQYGTQDEHLTGTTKDGKFTMVVDWSFDDLPTFKADLNNNGTLNGFSGADANIPQGAYITDAYVVVTTAFAGGTTYNMGFYEEDGSVIDVDGLDAAVAVADMGAGEVVRCNGALAGGTLSMAENGYLVIAATGTYTAGVAKLYIEYVNP